ncbi:HIT-like domain-containing protein [Podospora appendiculata]|uniref:Bis(5'-adenosyl)-triphosphatase n=1 Tax=Podospora appendiculata TaxID=314037 RepID=A0AAE1CCL3_9PEZI|nr:HIT-like domain-containing protein [Podospora appendiculata]
MSTSSASASASADEKQQQHPRGIHFGPFEVTNQIFMTTPHSFALVNLKPLLPGHVLVCPRRPAQRLTELSAPELTDLFTSVQRVQRMLARHYFLPPPSPSPSPSPETQQEQPTTDPEEATTAGSFNIAIQDGPEAGQTVSHVHVHVIPRIRGSTAKAAETPSDELYERMAAEDGNVGGAQWDRELAAAADAARGRPQPGGRFPSIEDAQRRARSMGEMEAEAALYRRVLRELEEETAR